MNYKARREKVFEKMDKAAKELLITEDGCEVLSEGIMRDADAIEAFMAECRRV